MPSTRRRGTARRCSDASYHAAGHRSPTRPNRRSWSMLPKTSRMSASSTNCFPRGNATRRSAVVGQYEAIVPTVRDRVCQPAAKIGLEPIFEADFLPVSFGFRPKRSATDALDAVWIGGCSTASPMVFDRQLDRHVTWRLHRLLVKKRGRSLRAGQADLWTEAWFLDQALHKLLGTIRYPKAA